MANITRHTRIYPTHKNSLIDRSPILNKTRHHYIIGAGVSGLVLAHNLLLKGERVTILEASDCVGGLARTEIIDGLPIDAGPHLFHTDKPDILDYWRSILGDSLVERHFYSANYIDGKYYDYPLNKESIHKQFSSRDVERIKLELSACAADDLSLAGNYQQYVLGLAGKFLEKKFFRGYPEKVWGIPTSQLSARFAPKRVEIRDERRPFHSGNGKWAGTIEGGCGTFANNLAKEVMKLNGLILFGARVVKLDNSNGRVNAIILSDGEILDTRNSRVISTIPLDKIAYLFGIPTDLGFRSCYSVNILAEGDDLFPSEYDWLYFPDKRYPYHRVGVQTRFSTKGFSDKQHLLCCEIAYSEKPSDQQITEWVEQSIENLERDGFLRKEKIVSTYNMDIGPLYPLYFLGHESEVKRVNYSIQNFENHHTLGSLAEYSYADLQILTAKAIDLAELLTEVQEAKELSLQPSEQISIGDHIISENHPVFSIAEIGLNHNGSVELAKRLIKEASNAGFTAAKLQTFEQGRVSRKTKSARYNEETLDQEETLADLLDRLIFKQNEIEEIFEYGRSLNILVFSTPFDLSSVEALEKIGVPAYKVSSMDINNVELISRVAVTGKPIIISTGMADLGDIERAINVVLKNNNPNVIVLHCVSSYPCDIRAANLSRIKKIRDCFGVLVGYSDHTEETHTPAFAVLNGAVVIEKHVTLDKNMDGPDHQFSLIPEEQNKMVTLIEHAQASINTSAMRKLQFKSFQHLRRSVYTRVPLRKGMVVERKHLAIKSPGDGLDPSQIDLVLGKRIQKDVDCDLPIKLNYFLVS